MRFKRPTTTDIDFSTNVLNLVDVLLLLLIFFMISTTFTKHTELNISLPQATGQPPQQAAQPLEIVITASGHYSINERALASAEIDTIKAALTEVSGGDTTRPLIITADASTPHQAVVRAMDAAGQLGFTRLSLTTQEPTEGR
ncbi:MAG: biopolymer transporter ExbD [Thauera sp.]|jgi:biopolymer transport protein ExbD|nr:biopolymer transporter ExbD [Thauera sp.]